MNKIMFRGRTKDGRWAHGDLCHDYMGVPHISYWIDKLVDPSENYWEPECQYHEIDPMTAGQRADVSDKNGKLLYQGDLCKLKESILLIDFENGSFVAKYMITEGESRSVLLSMINFSELETIGNIHDEPELLHSEVTNILRSVITDLHNR